MPDSSNNPASNENAAMTVLHIRPDQTTGSAAREIDQHLADALVRVEACGDVYRGLARICGGDTVGFHAVVVCVDALLAPDMEFFSVLAQTPGGVPAYVYGHARSEVRLTEALDLGATARVTEEWILSLGRESADDLIVEPPDSAPASFHEDGFGAGVDLAPDKSETPIAADVLLITPSTAPNQQAEAVESPAEHPQDDSELVAAPQVPWLRRTGTARRVRSIADGEPTRAVSHEPLLSNAEISALLGDDEVDSHKQATADDDGGPS